MRTRGIPFVFVTGYGIESVDTRFSEIPVLQKPIERETLQRIFINGRSNSHASAARPAGGVDANGEPARAATV
jgi:hypothetical protein